MKKHSETSNKIFNGLLYSFELGADPKRFIVSSEIFKGESTLLRTNNAFLENIGQLDWVTDFQADQWDNDPFPIDKCGDALRLGVNKIGITILYNPNIHYKHATLQHAIDSINDSMKLTHQKLTVFLKIINQESKENNDLLVLEAVCVQHEIDHLNGLTIFDREYTPEQYRRTEKKYGRNEIVTISKGEKTLEVKYKKSIPYLEKGWKINE